MLQLQLYCFEFIKSRLKFELSSGLGIILYCIQ